MFDQEIQRRRRARGGGPVEQHVGKMLDRSVAHVLQPVPAAAKLEDARVVELIRAQRRLDPPEALRGGA